MKRSGRPSAEIKRTKRECFDIVWYVWFEHASWEMEWNGRDDMMYTVYLCLCLLIFNLVTWVSIACLTFASFGGNNWIKFRWWHEPGRSERLCGSLYASLFCISFGAPRFTHLRFRSDGWIDGNNLSDRSATENSWILCKTQCFFGGDDVVTSLKNQVLNCETLMQIKDQHQQTSTNIYTNTHLDSDFTFCLPFSSMFANKDKWKDFTKWDPQVKCPPNGVWKPSRSRSLRQRISRRLESWMKGRHLEYSLKKQQA